jgi:hypothetical protein
MKICQYYNNLFNIFILNKVIIKNKFIVKESPERYAPSIININKKFLWDSIVFPKKYKKKIISLSLQDRYRYLIIQEVLDKPLPIIHIKLER